MIISCESIGTLHLLIPGKIQRAAGGAYHELLIADFDTRTAEPKLVRVRRPPTHLIPLLAKPGSTDELGGLSVP